MHDVLSSLSDSDLQAMVAALRSRRVSPPYTSLQLSQLVSTSLTSALADYLAELDRLGFDAQQIVVMLECVLSDRKQSNRGSNAIDLVTSGPEAPGVTNRDTSVVVRELFKHAQQSVMVVGYAVYQGQRVFQALADRMHELPNLDVGLFLNIARDYRDKTPSEILVSRFKHRFVNSQWPTGSRLPKVYYDQRSLVEDTTERSALHAKCIVVDGQHLFISSANFTEAAQYRNIEVGIKITSQPIAQQLTQHFQKLIDYGTMLPVIH